MRLTREELEAWEEEFEEKEKLYEAYKRWDRVEILNLEDEIKRRTENILN